jgi:hypothetical protein
MAVSHLTVAKTREAIVALDFFTVPTVSFRVLYCSFVIEHARRRVVLRSIGLKPKRTSLESPGRPTTSSGSASWPREGSAR